MAARAKSPSKKSSDSSANLGFEAKLWLSADKLRNNMDAAEPSGARQTAASSPKGERGGANQYKHVVLGLIFLKYISDTGGEIRISNDECRVRNTRLTPAVRHSHLEIRTSDARWPQLQSRAKLPSIGKDVDDREMANVECGMTNCGRSTSTIEIRQSKFA